MSGSRQVSVQPHTMVNTQTHTQKDRFRQLTGASRAKNESRHISLINIIYTTVSVIVLNSNIEIMPFVLQLSNSRVTKYLFSHKILCLCKVLFWDDCNQNHDFDEKLTLWQPALALLVVSQLAHS